MIFFLLDTKYIAKSGLGQKMTIISDKMSAPMNEYEAFSKKAENNRFNLISPIYLVRKWKLYKTEWSF